MGKNDSWVILSNFKLIFYPVLFINVIANIVNALLQALLIFGMGYGVRGAAISINIANLTQLILMILYIYKTKVYEPTWPGLYPLNINFHNWKYYIIIRLVLWVFVQLEVILNAWICRIWSHTSGMRQLSISCHFGRSTRQRSCISYVYQLANLVS